jgi:hypothetical protein
MTQHPQGRTPTDIAGSPYRESQIRQDEREKVLEELKKDLRTRFVSSDSQWSRGRNSGLLECCNIIDEGLRKGGEQE